MQLFLLWNIALSPWISERSGIRFWPVAPSSNDRVFASILHVFTQMEGMLCLQTKYGKKMANSLQRNGVHISGFCFKVMIRFMRGMLPSQDCLSTSGWAFQEADKKTHHTSGAQHPVYQKHDVFKHWHLFINNMDAGGRAREGCQKSSWKLSTSCRPPGPPSPIARLLLLKHVDQRLA